MSEQQDDGQLLRTFNEQGDESAFAELMRRHGGLVRTAACNVLGNASAAEDIAQATFLALVRKAGSLNARNGTLAGWLYRVATCLARNARRDEFRRMVREEETAMLASDADRDTSATMGAAALAALCEELGNLAEKYRQAVILHHLEGMSYEAAAPLCGCNATTFGMRLTRGREELRTRLTRRGVTLGATALVAALGQSVASAAPLSETLVAATCKAAVGIAAGGSAAAAGGGLISAKVASLTDGALKMLFWGQVKTMAVVCATVAAVGGGGVGVALSVMHPQSDRAEPIPPAVAVIAPVASATPSEDGAVLFQDSFENGLNKWMLYTRQGEGERYQAVEGQCRDIRIVKVDRDGKTMAAAELTGRKAENARVGMTRSGARLPAVDRWSLAYEYTYEGPPRRAMEGIEIGWDPDRPLTQPARPAGEWNQVRWEYEWKTNAADRPHWDAKLFFNGELIGGRTEYRGRGPGSVGVMLEVSDGTFRFANVAIREMKKEEGKE